MALKKLVLNAIEKEIDQYADKILKLEQQEVHVKTGAIRRSLTKEKKGKGHYVVGVDTSKLKADPRNKGGIDYAPFYYYGHKGYTIYPKKKKVLRWIGKDGKEHFAKYVRIPPSAGDPFLERVILSRPKL